MRIKAAIRLVIPVALFVGAAAVAVAAAPEPDLTPNFPLARITRPLDVTSLAADRIAPASTTREVALERARDVVDMPDARFRVFRAVSRKYENSADRDVWVIVFEGGRAVFGGPRRAVVEEPVVKLTGIIIDANTGEFLRGFMEGE